MQMDFDLTEEHRMVQEMVRGFTEKEVKPVAAPMDREGQYPADLVKKLGQIGLMGMFVAPEFGGSGMDLLSYSIAVEEISKAWASLSVIMSVHNSLVCGPLQQFGSEAQKKKYLLPSARGEILGCYALTEPGAGSDAGGIQTRARRDGKNYLLSGSKVLITSGKHADIAIVYAVTDPSLGKKGISAFIVEKGFSGFSVGKVEDKLGLRSSDTAELIFSGLPCSHGKSLGGGGRGSEDCADDSRGRPDRDCCPGRRNRPRVFGGVVGLCKGAAAIRAAHC